MCEGQIMPSGEGAPRCVQPQHKPNIVQPMLQTLWEWRSVLPGSGDFPLSEP